MKLFYTGADKFDGVQPFHYKSLGGFISSSEIPNDSESNLFDAISKYTIWNTRGLEYRAIAIYNDTASTISGLKMWVAWNSSEDSDDNNIDDQYAAIGLGYQAPTIDSCGDLQLEKLPSAYSKPLNVNLVETAIDLSTAINLPAIEAGMYLGIFLSRRILPAAKQPLSNELLAQIASGELELATHENFHLTFSWT